MRGEISRIIEALSLIEECRTNFPYGRTSKGGFEPPEVVLPTWVWHDLVQAMEEYCKLTGVDLKGEDDPQGGIDQFVRTFRAVAQQSDDPRSLYSHDGEQFHPPQLSLPTPVWHEIVLLSHQQTAEWERLEAYRPPTMKGRE